jgi:hypothetical protein
VGEWLNPPDCKSGRLAYAGSNPAPSTIPKPAASRRLLLDRIIDVACRCRSSAPRVCRVASQCRMAGGPFGFRLRFSDPARPAGPTVVRKSSETVGPRRFPEFYDRRAEGAVLPRTRRLSPGRLSESRRLPGAGRPRNDSHSLRTHKATDGETPVSSRAPCHLPLASRSSQPRVGEGQGEYAGGFKRGDKFVSQRKAVRLDGSHRQSGIWRCARRARVFMKKRREMTAPTSQLAISDDAITTPSDLRLH